MYIKDKIHFGGFTLIEMLVVIVMIAIFAAMAIPSYQDYTRRAIASQAQQEIQRISVGLGEHSTRNFNYLGYQTTPNPVVLPVGATGTAIKYTIIVRDGADPTKALTDSGVAGQSWVIRAETTDVQNTSFVLHSNGIRCKRKGTTIALDCSGAGVELKW